ILKRRGGLRNITHRHPSANALPCISMEDRQGLEHVRFTRDHAPARPDNVVKESLSAVQADASLREELAAVSDQAAPQPGVTQLLGSSVCTPLSEKPLVALARLDRVAHGLNSAKFDGFLGNETKLRFPLGLASIQLTMK